MAGVSENQVEEWLKKLERESWQLELLVSAFTIFLLLGANSSMETFLTDLVYQYNTSTLFFTLGYFFLVLIQYSVKALTISLIIHLMLRGFWIGTIGLRSVQPNIEYKKLNYTDFFTEKIKKNVISLDQLVVKLDELCSVIFAFSFLVISVLIATGLYFLFVGFLGFILSLLVSISPSAISSFVLLISIVITLIVIVTGLIFMIDFFTLGFFKRIKWFGRVYYPFYRFYNLITLSNLSRSIYYYLISKFSKRRIRFIYFLIGSFISFIILLSFDEHQYFPDEFNKFQMVTNSYNDERPEDEYIEAISIESRIIQAPILSIFFRYNPLDNNLIRNNCPDFEPIKDDGFNWNFMFKTHAGGFQLTKRDYADEDFEKLLSCQSSIYQISINDSIYMDIDYHFYTHPGKDQKGLLGVIQAKSLIEGQNILEVKKVRIDSIGQQTATDLAYVPFWYYPD